MTKWVKVFDKTYVPHVEPNAVVYILGIELKSRWYLTTREIEQYVKIVYNEFRRDPIKYFKIACEKDLVDPQVREYCERPPRPEDIVSTLHRVVVYYRWDGEHRYIYYFVMSQVVKKTAYLVWPQVIALIVLAIIIAITLWIALPWLKEVTRGWVEVVRKTPPEFYTLLAFGVASIGLAVLIKEVGKLLRR